MAKTITSVYVPVSILIDGTPSEGSVLDGMARVGGGPSELRVRGFPVHMELLEPRFLALDA